MFDNKKRKEDRLNDCVSDTMDVCTYNLVMGICVLYGLIVNAILVNVAGPFMESINYSMFIIVYFVCITVGALISAKSSNPFLSFIGYNLICISMGLLLALFLPFFDAEMITNAALATALVTTAMVLLSQVFPKFFNELKSVLFFGLLAMVVIELIFLIAGWSTGWIDFIAVGLFSLYIGYDFHVAQRYPKTLDNAVDCTVDLYLDIINLFVRLLRLFARSRSRN